MGNVISWIVEEMCKIVDFHKFGAPRDSLGHK